MISGRVTLLVRYSFVEFSKDSLHGTFLRRRNISWALSVATVTIVLRSLKKLDVHAVKTFNSKCFMLVEPKILFHSYTLIEIVIIMHYLSIFFSKSPPKCDILLCLLWISGYVNLFMLIYNTLLGFSAALFSSWWC